MSKRKKTSPASVKVAEHTEQQESGTSAGAVLAEISPAVPVAAGQAERIADGAESLGEATRAERIGAATPVAAPAEQAEQMDTATDSTERSEPTDAESAAAKVEPSPAAAVEETEPTDTDIAAAPENVEGAAPNEGADSAAREPAVGEDAAATEDVDLLDGEATVNLTGDLPFPGRDDLDEPTVSSDDVGDVNGALIQRKHLRGLLEALIFASDTPIKPNDLAKLASTSLKHVKELLVELRQEYASRGIHLDEVAGGWVFRTSAQYAPFVRDLTKQKPVRLSRAQVETLAIIAYRQPITRPEIDDVRGVDSGPVLKVLLERDLVRILGKRDEPGRPLIYGTTNNFLEFFGLRSLKDLPTLREFTELTDESRDVYEAELGEPPHDGAVAEHAEAMAEQRAEEEPSVDAERDFAADETGAVTELGDDEERS